jgi:hypothetical protein
MKIYLTVFLFFVSLNSAFGQDSIAISETGTWVMLHSYPVQGWDPQTGSYIWVPEEDYYLYKNDGDTLINAVQYKKLRRWWLNYDNDQFSIIGSAEGFHQLAYRNDSSLRAYRILEGETTEELWYDFNLQIGDTILATEQPAAFTEIERYVYDIDSVDFCDSTYKQFVFTEWAGNPASPYEKNAALKVGSLSNLVDNNWVSGAYYKIVFFCESPTEFADLYNLLGVNQEEQEYTLIYPNPVEDYLFLKGAGESQAFTIYSMDGKLLEEGVYQESIDVQELGSGQYVLILNDTGKSLRFIKK